MNRIMDLMPVMIFYPYPQDPLALVYYYAPREAFDEKKLTKNLLECGFDVDEMVGHQHYDRYFPQLSVKDVLKIKTVQGLKSMYFIGENFTFSALPDILEYNEKVFSVFKKNHSN